MMQAHYRSVLDFSNEALLASEKGYHKLMDAITSLQTIEPNSPSNDFDVISWKQRCYDAMNDDFNTPILIAELFSAVKYINQIKDDKNSIDSQHLIILRNTIHAFVFEVLGLTNSTNSNSNDKLSDAIQVLIQLRHEARAQKNFKLSDQIRDQLAAVGIQLKDGKDGTSFSLD
jgi:cysteinyl-tRNA synthetase